MEVRVKFFTQLKEIVGRDEELITLEEGAVVDDVLESLVKKYGRPFVEHVFDSGGGELASHLQVIVDGVNAIFLEGEKARLRDGAVVAIVPMVSGG